MRPRSAPWRRGASPARRAARLAAWLGRLALAGACAGLPVAQAGQPVLPSHDGQVLERLPARMALGASRDAQAARADARQLLEQARALGDPRPAGQALARLAPWRHDAGAPPALLVTLAEVEQYLHRFDDAVRRLDGVLQRDPAQPQAWLMLAALHRVQGRLADAERACQALQALRAQPWAAACAAEGQGLRGEFDAARERFNGLLQRSSDAGTRGWLYTSLAELEQRAARPEAADSAWQQAVATDGALYARIGRADFLLDQGRAAEAWDLLRDAPDADGVLLRRAIAAQRSGRPEAARLARTVRERQAQADQRPGGNGHERERSLQLLALERQPCAAWQAAQRNVALQREAIDLLLLHRAAQACGRAEALAEARATAQRTGLVDLRREAL
ncbi:tetratricopeptide repeat protein [Aquabacterium sp. OR-4]|uniref:tetratricopeptide repeat protein n=1 Tax=Aquabacterium sp. OR-4 TaxID=2978127 RepID=UPI0021B3B222|nr:tetratricopeptide repeat protein [Aquabacterium sp. OR-4]MDT7835275.1 tetratricopeptide repeat protein [Aquabacterium sp. OR-4]